MSPAQYVTVASGSAGAGVFSRQLFANMLSRAAEIGLVEDPSVSLKIFCSPTSFKEFTL